MKEALKILKQYWGYDEFRPGQLDIISAVLANQDVLALLPTGGGKSICYQIPSLIKPGTCLVISPLVALMNDQHQGLKKLSISSVNLGGISSKKEIERLSNNWLQKRPKFIFLSPERLNNRLVIERLKLIPINHIVFDEAHCISHWGHQFRPAYRKITSIKDHFPDLPIVALTATATKFVQDDIINQCKLKKPLIHQGHFLRPNLSFVAEKSQENSIKTWHYTQQIRGSKIVYCNSRKKTEEWSDFLNRKNIKAIHFHAGLSTKDKEKSSQEWIKSNSTTICATSAFGMGIDKANVRLVIHPELSATPEDLYQEAGRAGRNGEKAFCIALWNEKSLAALKSRLLDHFPEPKTIIRCYNALGSYFQLAIHSHPQSEFELNLGDFSTRYNFKITEAFYCLQLLQKEGLISLNEEGRPQSKMIIRLSPQSLYDHKIRYPDLEALLTLLARVYPGIVGYWKSIDENKLAQEIGVTPSWVEKKINKMLSLGIAEYKPKTKHLILRYDKARANLKPQHLSLIKELKSIAQNQYHFLESYCLNTRDCRQQLFANYFNTHCSPCGRCDNCVRKATQKEVTPSLVLENLKHEKSMEELLASHKYLQLHKVKTQEILNDLLNTEQILYQNGKYICQHEQ